MAAQTQREPKTLSGKLTLWISITSGAVTLILAVISAYTSNRLQEQEQKFKTIQLELSKKDQDMAKQKADVERYEWVFKHFDDIQSANQAKRNFATSLVRLALSKQEAEQLFTSLQNSGDTVLQKVGQAGVSNISSEPIAALVSRLDAATSNERISAFNELKSKYNSSSSAIGLVLNLYNNDRINTISPNGIINGLYFLGATETGAWTPDQIETANALLANAAKNNPGKKTQAALDNFKAQLVRLKATRNK